MVDILPLIKRLINVDPKHFGWGSKTVSSGSDGSKIKSDIFIIMPFRRFMIFDISKDDLEAHIEDLDESDLIHGLLRVVSENGMRILLWEEKVLQETVYFVRIWKPNESSQSIKEIKGNELFRTICLAYLSNYE